jgi:hypothetical protein
MNKSAFRTVEQQREDLTMVKIITACAMSVAFGLATGWALHPAAPDIFPSSHLTAPDPVARRAVDDMLAMAAWNGAERHHFERLILRLDPDERALALQRLAEALNSGAIRYLGGSQPLM